MMVRVMDIPCKHMLVCLKDSELADASACDSDLAWENMSAMDLVQASGHWLEHGWAPARECPSECD